MFKLIDIMAADVLPSTIATPRVRSANSLRSKAFQCCVFDRTDGASEIMGETQMSGSNDPWWPGNGPPPSNVIVAVLCWLVLSGLVSVFNMVSAQTAVGIG